MSKNSIFALVSQFLGQQNNISVPVPLVRITGDYTAAAFLSQIVYWSDRTSNLEGWFHKTHEEWLEELHLSSDQVRRCVKTADGLIEVKRAGVPARNYYRLNRELLIDRLQDLASGNIVSTSRNGETQQLAVDKPNDLPLGNPTASRTADPTSITKTTSKITSKITSKRGVSNVTNNPREALAEHGTPAAQAATQESQSVQVPRSSSEDASLETAGAPDQELETEALLEEPAATPTADAADSLALTDNDLDELFGAGNVDDKAPEEVAPGAAVAPAALSVAALHPVPRDELMAREVAVMNSEEYRAIKVLFGKYKLEEMLGELTATGGFSREDWLRLSLGEIAQAREAAKREAQSAGGSMVTFAARALDRLIGAVSTQKSPQQAAQQLGAAYILRSKVEPEPEAPSQGKYEPGALYRPKAGGPEVQLMSLEAVKSKIAGAGARYRLSDGQVVPMLELISKFEFLGRADVPA